jgi:ABC-type glutathione transport system ATPase component
MSPKIRMLNFTVSHQQKNLLELEEFIAYPGEVHAVIGESGSGKSLLLKQILGFIPKNLQVSAKMTLDLSTGIFQSESQQEFEAMSLRGKYIGMVFQDPLSALNPQMTCAKQLMEAWNVHAPKKDRNHWDVILERLHDVGLTDETQRILTSFPHQLSGGQRQRVVIAMATLHRPEILLADEPTTALDYFSREKVLQDLLKVVKKQQSTLIWVTHELDVVSKFADRVTVLRKGVLVQTGTTQEVLQERPEPYVKELLAPLPKKTIIPSELSVYTLEIKALSKVYPNKTRALDQINLSVEAGQTLAVIGTSGSGKSTLAKILVALEHATEGTVLFQGERLASRPPTGIQMVFQDPFSSLNRKQTAVETLVEIRSVSFPREHKKVSLEKAIQGLKEVALDEDLWYKKPTEMSGGQRQRLGIAKALACSPKALILDEAVAALDPLVKKQILDLLLKIQAERKLLYIFITHDLPVAACIADQWVFLKNGKQESLPQEWRELMEIR